MSVIDDIRERAVFTQGEKRGELAHRLEQIIALTNGDEAKRLSEASNRADARLEEIQRLGDKVREVERQRTEARESASESRAYAGRLRLALTIVEPVIQQAFEGRDINGPALMQALQIVNFALQEGDALQKNTSTAGADSPYGATTDPSAAQDHSPSRNNAIQTVGALQEATETPIAQSAPATTTPLPIGDTPRTEAEAFYEEGGTGERVVGIEFAKQLERELNARNLTGNSLIPFGHEKCAACNGRGFVSEHDTPARGTSLADELRQVATTLRAHGYGLTAAELDALADRQDDKRLVAGASQCDHEWVDARSQVVKDGEICVKCYALRAGNATGTTPCKWTGGGEDGPFRAGCNGQEWWTEEGLDAPTDWMRFCPFCGKPPRFEAFLAQGTEK